jgi:hypothetical protein
MSAVAAVGSDVRHVLGLDLGQQSDPSALTLLQWRQAPPAPVLGNPWHVGPPPAPPPRPTFTVPTLFRWPLGTAYPTIAADLVRFLMAPPLAGTRPLLVVDGTGVGVPVVEMLKERLIAARVDAGMVGVCITGGNTVSNSSPGWWNVSKRQLVSVLQVLLGERRLKVSPQLEQAAVLVRELNTFQVKITAPGNETFESWRERDHDDLVLALALACWAAVSLQWPPAPPPGPIVLMT